MSTPDTPSRHSDDAHSDDGAPTDAVTDEVRDDAAAAEQRAEPDDETAADDPGFPAAEGRA